MKNSKLINQVSLQVGCIMLALVIEDAKHTSKYILTFSIITEYDCP